MSNGGTERTYQFYKRLINDGFAVDVICGGNVKNSSRDSCFHITTPQRNYKRLFWFFLRLFEYLCRLFGMPVTEYTLWNKKAKSFIKKRIKNIKYDLCIVTYGPIDNLDIGLWANKKYKMPLLSDFRDGLLYEPFDEYFRIKSYKKKCSLIESKIAANSSYIISTTPQLTEYFKQMYSINNVTTILNGFDDEQIINADPLQIPHKGHLILYTGGIDTSRFGLFAYAKDSFEHMFTAFLNDTFVFIGSFKDYEMLFFSRFNNVVVLGRQDREMILQTQKEADALLLISGNLKSGTSGKLFEYLFAKKPILNIGIDNNGSRIIEETISGKTFLPTQFDRMDCFLNDVFNKKYLVQSHNIDNYTRKKQYQQFKRIVECITNNNGK